MVRVSAALFLPAFRVAQPTSCCRPSASSPRSSLSALSTSSFRVKGVRVYKVPLHELGGLGSCPVGFRGLLRPHV